MTACNGPCADCPNDFCAPAVRARPSKAVERKVWRQEALFELEDLAELYGIDPSSVRL